MAWFFYVDARSTPIPISEYDTQNIYIYPTGSFSTLLKNHRKHIERTTGLFTSATEEAFRTFLVLRKLKLHHVTKILTWPHTAEQLETLDEFMA